MKKIVLRTLLCLAYLALTFYKSQAQISPRVNSFSLVDVPWNNSQLLKPSQLAEQIKTGKANTIIIFNIGAVQDIKGAKHIGPVNKSENMEKFKNVLTSLPKNSAIIIYCGCCPFAKCPNIGPAFLELKKSGFTNIKVLDLAKNLQTNWITPGYPLAPNSL